MSKQKDECFWCPEAGTKLINGVTLCDSHAVCANCLKELTETGVGCHCVDTGYLGDEEKLYCSWECRDACHPPTEPWEKDTP